MLQFVPGRWRTSPSGRVRDLPNLLRNGVFPGLAAQAVSSRYCRISFLCRKDSHEGCSRNRYFVLEGRATRRALGTTLGEPPEAWRPMSDVRTAEGSMNI